ncbi:UDP-N-acetylmuramoyl-L-alanyl-D-glutamate--2,6-diaminopimelate ligase [Geosporobacter ferrireducens]|uniref:UDP-N-acetylmuramoyl-L-alanyl-D-glutamate--2,6-diaminopimelate ligase n=1 Tax=Geosporobacter ferrireducens TaxID=1424294 RepID=A0A1D8GC33_9FIRM|nr:UDP-N-acetylmuramoyl-L-alanyl-D-glutamate--2,6-diaminopimelate ligase [Geosporobacter ferrireducens]AOT68466.1 UDP-N-acetylmuramoyl-L-alanyl-D-glutamate--2,6-diaminopimelate ligase [Geosporobacter ferrireducens]MTI53925.1 UDP-N-acetylmuramoyl-L-alanyl-D-glutamate--2,6-diaminopimelate ligase [Geosporobacter ferrireducens]
MDLKELLECVHVLYIDGNQDLKIQGIAYDSRKVEKDFAFVCISGSKTDGHLFIEDVIAKGAKAIVVEREVQSREGITFIKVENSRKALSAMAASFYGYPSNAMNVIGVTGTNGKTTTTHLVKNILAVNGVQSGLIGTISYKILDQEYKANNTTPESLELQKLFQEMLDQKVSTCVMEVSSHSLDLYRVEDIQYQIGVFTNLTQDHLDFHGNMENYKNAKRKLFYKTKQANIINVDDAFGVELSTQLHGMDAKCITYGIKRQAEINAKDIEITSKGTRFQLVTPKFSGIIDIGTPGMFSVYNALAAAAVGYVTGYDYLEIKKGLEETRVVPGRFELVPNDKDLTVIVDYSHTPDSIENAIRTIQEFAKGRIITVFGCGGDRDKTKRPIMGEIAGRLSDYCIITSDNPRTEKPEEIIKDAEVGIKRTSCKYKMIVDRKEGIREAIRQCGSQDVILIAGKGHETYQIIGDRVIDFDDRKIAQELIREDLEDEVDN